MTSSEVWSPVVRDFGAWMRYRNLSTSTQRIYTGAVLELSKYLLDHGAPAPPEVSRRDLEGLGLLHDQVTGRHAA